MRVDQLDAIRKREDRLLREIAQLVLADAELLRADEPQTVEDAIHRLMPISANARQLLHDGLCIIYDHAQPADPREQLAYDFFLEDTAAELARLPDASRNLVLLGLKTPNLSDTDDWFVQQARHLNSFLFEDMDDKQFVLDLMKLQRHATSAEILTALRATDEGGAVCDRWDEWVHACFPTCPYERRNNRSPEPPPKDLP